MAEFKSYRSYRDFAFSVTNQSRYSRSPDRLAFLQAVLGTSKRERIPAGSKLWRAALGNVWIETDVDGELESVPVPFDLERMKPRTHQAAEGRANPLGIPFLYAATHLETAIAEVRPWIGSYVSVAQFPLRRDVYVVDCVTGDRRIMAYAGEPEPLERQRQVWQDIDQAFSQPVTRGDDVASYAPTQVIAEFLRENGLDGVAYGSSLGPGHNLALFDLEVADPVNRQLVVIKSAKLDFDFEPPQ